MKHDSISEHVFEANVVLRVFVFLCAQRRLRLRSEAHSRACRKLRPGE